MSTTTECWEQCFQSTNEDTLSVYKDLFRFSYEAKRLKNIHTAFSLSFLLDSTIATFCPSSSSESFENVIRSENATAIWNLQLQLMAIISTVIGNSKVFPVQFNENAAWGCSAYSCLDVCGVYDLVNNNLLTPLQTNLTSCNDGLLEPACRAAYKDIQDTSATCTGVGSTNIAIAILNSRAHSHVHVDNLFRDFSPCHSLYPIRMGLGLHHANENDIRRFSTHEQLHAMLSDSYRAQVAIQQMYSCMNAKCCPIPGTPATVTSCNLVYGDGGEYSSVISSINPTVG